MTDDPICGHGDIRADCIDCSIAPPKPRIIPPVVGLYSFVAQFSDTPCLECGFPIDAGQRMALMSDESYRHASCVDRWTT